MTSQGCYFMQCYRDLIGINASDVTFSSHSPNLPKDVWDEVLSYLRRNELDVVCLASRRLRKLVVENGNHLALRDLGTVFLNVGRERDRTRLLVSYRLLDEVETHHISPPGNHRKQWRLFLRCLNNAVVHALEWDRRIILDRKVLNYWRKELDFMRHFNCHFILGLTIPVRIECLGEAAFFETMRKRFVRAPASISFVLNSAPHNELYRAKFPYEREQNYGYFTADERFSFALKFLTRVVFADEHCKPIAKRIFLSYIQRQPLTDFEISWSAFDIRFLDIIINAFLSLRGSVELPSEVVVSSLPDYKLRLRQSSWFSSWKHAENHPYEVTNRGRVYRFLNPHIHYLLRLVLTYGTQWTDALPPPMTETEPRTISFIVLSRVDA